MTIPTPAVPHRTERPWGWLEAVAAQPGFKIKRIGLLPGWVHRLANQTTNPLEIDEVQFGGEPARSRYRALER